MTDISTWDNDSSEEELSNGPSTDTMEDAVTERSTTVSPSTSLTTEETSPLLINKYNFSNQNQWKGKDQQPESKAFLAYKDTDTKKILQSVGPFYKEDTGNILEMIAKQFNLKVNEVSVQYELPNQNGSGTRMVLRYNKDKKIFDNSQLMFYCTTEDLSTIIISKEKKEVRVKRPIEELHTSFKRHRVIHRDVYKNFLQEKIIATYLMKLKNFRILMGSPTCMNLMNPGYFFCHIPACPAPEVELRSFNNTSSVIDHWKKHTRCSNIEKFQEDESCVQLLRRYDFLKDKFKDYNEKDITTVIEDLEVTCNAAKRSLEIKDLMINKCLVFKESKFSSRDRLINEEVLRKLANGEESALLEIPEVNNITSYFTKKAKKSSQASKSG